MPPLSPIMNMIEGEGSEADTDDIFPAIDNMRIPIEYLANLLTAGDTELIRTVLKKMAVMRSYMRAEMTGKTYDNQIINDLGLQEDDIKKMYRLLMLLKMKNQLLFLKIIKKKFKIYNNIREIIN